MSQEIKKEEGISSQQRVYGRGGKPFLRSVVEDVMACCSSLSWASRKNETREFRIQEIRRLLMQYKVAVFVLELALQEENRAKEVKEVKDGVPKEESMETEGVWTPVIPIVVTE